MAVTSNGPPTALGTPDSDSPLDLRGHRLGDLVQVLAGCGAEEAELAVGSHPRRRLSSEDALDALAWALVRLGKQRSH